MDTLKKDSYRAIVFAVFLILTFSLNTIAEETISNLNQALTLCTDDELSCRIEYRIGILYFKSGDLLQALESFKKVARSANCADLAKLCSLNMTGQIYRVQAKNDKALKAFEELIEQSQKLFNQNIPASVLKLIAAAGFSRAEIYRYNQDYTSAIAEYKKIYAYLKSDKTPQTNNFAPLALDRISQLYLIKSKVENYCRTTAELIEKYPGYYRTPIIKLETETVRILKRKNPSIDFARGSFDAPAELIAFIKNRGNKELKDTAILLLKELSNQYRQSYGGIVLGYHYAWLLDASGEQKQAAKVFEDICKQAVLINPDTPAIAKVISTLTDYAKFQQAIILGEQSKYREALELAHSTKPEPNDVHMLNLADSIKNSLEILKREVPKDVNDQ